MKKIIEVIRKERLKRFKVFVVFWIAFVSVWSLMLNEIGAIRKIESINTELAGVRKERAMKTHAEMLDRKYEELKKRAERKRRERQMEIRERYKKIAGPHYVEEHYEIVHNVLKRRGYEFDEDMIVNIFYMGTHESHWNMDSRGGFDYKGVHYETIGAFQYVGSTFTSVSNGDILSLEDQIDATVTMFERGRICEFEVMHSCNFEPCIELPC